MKMGISKSLYVNGMQCPKLQFAKMNSEQIAKKRKELLAYCGLDTLAMVKVLEGLKELVK
jgi:hypothetical protein